MDLLTYKTLPVWDADSLPEAFRRAHRTQAGTWARLEVLRGGLDFEFLDEAGKVVSTHRFDTTRQPPLIEPERWHRITDTSADVQCQLQFLCTPDDYFNKKHGLTRTHSEVLAAVHQYGLVPGRTLDAGCGSGRNTLFLAHRGFEVDAWDVEAHKLEQINTIAQAEGLQGRVQTRCVDFNGADFTAAHTDVHGWMQNGPLYDLVLSTVVLMFLQPEAALRLVSAMQRATRAGGHNLIVAAMDTQDYPCPAGLFPFTFAPGQLRGLYAGWELRKYNENVGQLHRKDAAGNLITLRFATMLARKDA